MEFIYTKTIVSKFLNNENWFGSNYNINLYRGCSHGCIYCDSRSSCYGIQNFDTVTGKKNALEIITKEIKAKRKKGVIGMGAMSDTYNPFEKKYMLTRDTLKIINNYGFGVSIATKSNVILRDMDILSLISKHSPVIIKLSISTTDDALCKLIEPNVVPASKRFDTLNKITSNNIFAGILLMPVLPFIQDNEENIIKVVSLANKNGARFIYPGFGVTLRDTQRDWYFKNLDAKFNGVKDKYIRQYGNSYSCASPNAARLWQVFKKECNKYGILYKMPDIIKEYKKGYGYEQLMLF